MNGSFAMAQPPSDGWLDESLLIDECDAFALGRYARHLAKSLGIDSFRSAMMGNAVSEIAMNAIVHAGGGRSQISFTPNRRGLLVVISDEGNGIGDLESAFTDGVSSRGGISLGVGMGASQRAVDEFIVNYSERRGTSITLCQFLPLNSSSLDYKALSFPRLGQSLNGDSYCCREYNGDNLFVAVIRGVGGGLISQQAAAAAIRLLEEYSPAAPRDALIRAIAESVVQNAPEGDVHLGLAWITPTTVQYVGAGAITLAMSGADPVLVSGGEQPLLASGRTLRRYDASLNTGDGLLLASPGVALPGPIAFLNTRTAYEEAASIFNHYARDDDDATLLVTKIGNA